jgi:hypothetical protein
VPMLVLLVLLLLALLDVMYGATRLTRTRGNRSGAGHRTVPHDTLMATLYRSCASSWTPGSCAVVFARAGPGMLASTSRRPRWEAVPVGEFVLCLGAPAAQCRQ